MFELVFFGAVLISIVLNPWFDYRTHALSDLGSIGANQAWIFNLGLILTGILGIIFAIRILIRLPKPMDIFGYGMLTGAIFYIFVGIFPDNSRFYIIPNKLTFHLFFTLTGSLIVSIFILLYGIYWTWNREWRKKGITLLVVGFSLPLLAIFFGPPGLATIELVFTSIILLWSYLLIYHLCGSEKNEDNLGNS